MTYSHTRLTINQQINLANYCGVEKIYPDLNIEGASAPVAPTVRRLCV